MGQPCVHSGRFEGPSLLFNSLPITITRLFQNAPLPAIGCECHLSRDLMSERALILIWNRSDCDTLQRGVSLYRKLNAYNPSVVQIYIAEGQDFEWDIL